MPNRLGALVWVAELCEAEEFALTQDCRFAHVETYSFQARGSYKKHGYRLFAKLENYPLDHECYYLHKTLGVGLAEFSADNIQASTGSAAFEEGSKRQSSACAPAIDFECSQLFRASSSRLTGPRVLQKPAPWLRPMRFESTVCLLRKSTVYGLNGLRSNFVIALFLAIYEHAV